MILIFNFGKIFFDMTNYFKINKNQTILDSIDLSIKKSRDTENKKIPYAVVINTIHENSIALDNLTYFNKKVYISIPIIKNQNIGKNEIFLAFSEKELIDIVK
ncbi:hypothetical protein DBY21_02970 [Candidatus Gastranaerophilales bacterium]|nr:MAG: hypothetical protein DBY21_02970 [Candidatus Gastranaerophilales bacterium]